MTETTEAADDFADLAGATWSYVGGGAMTLPSGSDFAAGTVVSYGDSFTLTTAQLQNSVDRSGRSTLAEALRSQDEQLRRFAEIRFRPGPWPADTMRSLPGSPARLMAMTDERRDAQMIKDPDQRSEALRSLRLKYGEDWGAAGRSRTIGQRDGGRPVGSEYVPD